MRVVADGGDYIRLHCLGCGAAWRMEWDGWGSWDAWERWAEGICEGEHECPHPLVEENLTNP